jgi:hypothetical protein
VTEHYCAYLHHNYLPRALILYRSLVARGGPVRLHLLCLSDEARRVVEALDLPGVSTISLDQIEGRYPELRDVKPARWPMDYIFTLTPFLPSWVLAREPGLARVTYLDADLRFYNDPILVFEAIGDRSVAIVPHGFSPDLVEDVRFGRFNVGWITYAADAVGLRCLAEYRRDCLDWCHDRPEPGRFADQGYLDAWPDRYGAALAVLDGPGINVARWNADNHVIEPAGDGFTCDGAPLIFYHFQGIQRRPDGQFRVAYPRLSAGPGSVLRERIYAPYLAELAAETERLAARFPDVDFSEVLRAPRASVVGAAEGLARALAGVQQAILYGAGEIGAAFLDRRPAGLEIVACIDRDPALHGTRLHGVPIMDLESGLATGCRVVAVASIAGRDEMTAALRARDPDLRVIGIEGAGSD